MEFKVSVMMPYSITACSSWSLCLARVGAAEVSAACNSAPLDLGCAPSSRCCPRATPTCSQRCSGQTDTWAADMVAQFAHFPLSPGLSCQATPLTHLISHLCVHLVTVCVISTTKASVSWFFSLQFFFSSAFDTQCLFTPFSPCHGSWCQHTEWPALLHEWSPQWRDQHRDGDR